jgi:dihydrofolate reductase
MLISIIVAAAENGIIGKGNTLPWHMPADMKYFREKTMGHCVVTGRKNYESIPDKFRPLPGRTNIVITRNKNFQAPGAVVVHSLKDAIDFASQKREPELFIIGGGEIFREALPVTNTVYLTRIHKTIEGDVAFPELKSNEWKESARRDFLADEKNPADFSFLEYTRVNPL